MTSYGVPVATQAEPRPARPAARGVVTFFSVSALVGLALAPLAGWLWVVLADPPRAPLYSDGGIYLGEQALNQQAGVTLWFLVIGAAFGVAAGLAVGWFGSRFGWLTVVAVLVLCVIGSVVSRYAGAHVFGPDPRAEAAAASTGDLIRVGVQLDTWIAYLGWPIGGVLGALAAIAGWSRQEPQDTTPRWTTLGSVATSPSEGTAGTTHGRQHTPSGDTRPA